MAEDEHYFSADPSVTFRRMPVTATVWGHELSLTSGSGVFAQGRLDVGTAVLFRETSAPAGGRVLDLGCGYGVIGLAIAAAVPGATVTGIDVNERAVLLANENAAALGLTERFTATTPLRSTRGGDLRRALVEPADPDREGSAARAAAHLAAPAGARRPRGAGGGQEPRGRLAAALVGGAGLPDRANCECERLPGAGDSAPVITPWEDPDWLAGAVAWVDERLADLGRQRIGEPEQPHVRTWATALRVPTAAGPVWFKANTPELRHEVSVVERVSARVPDRVPPLLASDVDRGWMLMADAGGRLREVAAEERSLARWHDVLSGAADVARELEPDVDELVAAGVPDLRLHTLADGYADLVARYEVERRFRDAVGRVRDLVDELASYAVTETLQHDDLHDGQVFVKDGRNLILDWGDAVVSHPFFTMSVTLEGGVAWGLDDVADSEDIWPYVDSYLARYAPDRPELRDAVPPALRLGWVCRALNNPEVSGQFTGTRLRMFLDGRPE